MVTEQQGEIEKLELELAEKTKPCPHGGPSDLCPGKFLPCRSVLPFPRGFNGSYVDACPGGCNGTGVAPLIEGLREECMFQPSMLATWHYGKDCPRCEGRNWVPALDGTKVLMWMLSFGFSYVRLASDELFPGKIKALFIFNDRDIVIEGTNPYEVLLRAALAGIAAMNAEVES